MNVCDSLIIGGTQHRGGGNIHTLRLHEFGYAAGRVELSCGVGHEADEVVEEGDIADAVAFYHIFQHNGVVDAGEIFPIFSA